jgi:para-nitrobenzyl esterase
MRSIRKWSIATLAAAAACCFLLAPAFAEVTSTPDDATLAATSSGKVRGYIDHGIFAYKGIPYGGDTARFRFKAPEPPTPWQGVRDVIRFAHMAPQNGVPNAGSPAADAPPRRGGGGFFPQPTPGTPGAVASEDCLYLNVWTPGLRDNRRRPVMVYFHGGSYNGWSVNVDVYDGVRLAKKGDVVVVTVNHRLNGFGFLYLADLCGPEYADSGNVGMLDLIASLKWIKQNIAEFGGDPGNITLFGQSGGGAKGSTLMAMPAARGLFNRVITMSGQQLTGRTREHANENARQFLANLKLTPAEIHKIDSLTTDQLQAAMRGGTWTPVVDGRLLPRDPFSPDASPVGADVPMMKGNTRWETAGQINDPEIAALSWADGGKAVADKIKQHRGQYLGDLDPMKIVEDYRRLYPDFSAQDVFYAATTAIAAWKSMILEVEAKARQSAAGGAPIFIYQLDWCTPVDNGRYRAPHTLDIPLAFDNIAYAPGMVGTGPDTQKMADIVSASFIAFARTGNPDNPLIPRWPPYTLDKRATMEFDLVPKVVDDARGGERKIFEKLIYVQPGT